MSNTQVVTEKPNSKEALERLLQLTQEIITPLGYEAVALDQNTHGGRTLTLYIDFLEVQNSKISLDDCIKVNAAVDELFENTTLVDGNFNLEVSSPGVERPLRKTTDFSKFTGKKVRIHTFRSLSAEELENTSYWETHTKQKNFVGTLLGFSNNKVRLEIDGAEIGVPFELVSKANLEFTMPSETISENKEKH